ncbi:MAG: hypothetical protein ABIR91_01985 [Candidatus Saccharimonadales bacterium]
MGLFQGKQSAKQSPPVDDQAIAAAAVLDESLRDELRQYARDYFKQMIDDASTSFKSDVSTTIVQINNDVKEYATKQIDTTLATISSALSARLNERLIESDRVNKDAQDLVVQSLNRNAQALHEKYQSLSQTLQQTVASQEAMMITVFEENKARMNDTQASQQTILQTLTASVQRSQEQATQLDATLKSTVVKQENALVEVYKENIDRITSTKGAQDDALRIVTASAKALQAQADQLSATLEQTIQSQKTIMTDAFQQNMARVVEHYVLGALGDQYDMKAQLPSIIKQMEANKQAIVDDIAL